MDDRPADPSVVEANPDTGLVGAGAPPDPANIVIVLSRTTEPSNVGATCRAMKTMGLTNLRLVEPLNPKGRTARALAHGAEDVLDAALVCDTMAAAVSDCLVVCGTTARRRQLRKSALMPPHHLARRVVEHAREGRVAILFGTERTGLTNDEIDICRYLSMVPTDEAQHSLNLAHAVMLYAWEVRKAWLAVQGREDWVGTGAGAGAPPPRPEMAVHHPHRATKLPTQHELELVYAHLARAMAAIDFSEFERRKFLNYLRQLHNRAGLVNWELQIFHLLANRILKAAGAPKFDGLE
ncbi:MAG TPA: RNA methyltransferase [Candidatus Krumholzibacteria bacterium]|nr:RNA methyltransferase [Candidatus Krumholzibacteria bacterium]HPD70424.1 RNA methyltransferase [Candidatus Krumholzibacteria bacterium]HRY39876.1 RNA methyltransferase [Candidatus Krumholzibacteria bacterium]